MKDERFIAWLEEKLDSFKMYSAAELARWQHAVILFKRKQYAECLQLLRKRCKRDSRRKKSDNP